MGKKKNIVVVPVLAAVAIGAWFLGRISVSDEAHLDPEESVERTQAQPPLRDSDSSDEAHLDPEESVERTQAQPPLRDSDSFNTSDHRQKSPVQAMLSMRKRIAGVVEREVEPLETENDLHSYLDELLERAESDGKASAIHVEPGMEAINRFIERLGPEEAEKIRMDFSKKMSAFYRNATESEPKEEDLDRLAQEIGSASGKEKQDLIRRYLDSAGALDPEDQERALQRLNDLK